MAKLIKLYHSTPSKFGHKKVRGKKRRNLEDFGQLNLFTSVSNEARVISIGKTGNFQEALILDEQNDPRAKEAYQRAISSGDSVADAFCNLGILEAHQQENSAAIDAFTKALHHNPRHFEAHFNLANLYFDSGNLPLARLHYEVAQEIDPNDPNVYYNLSLTLVMSKDYASALDMLTKYKMLAPEEVTKHADNLMNSIKTSIKNSDNNDY